VALTRGLALADGPALLGGPPLTRGPALTYRLAPVRDLARMRQAARVAELKAARAVVPVLGSALRRGRAVAQELLLLGLAVAFGVASSAMGADATPETKAAGAVAKLTLTSPQITQGKTIAAEQVFNGFGCTGMNVSPALSWSGAPAGTKSFAVMVHDPDAPTGSGFWHWVVYDIPADTKSLPADAGDPSKKLMPAGAVQARTDFGTPGYGGPCPPPGKPHHYHFRLYALKVSKLAVPPDATAALIGFNVNANKLAEADLVGLYGR
jgi:Raf kinase inhibitor-like YbhB/YbcL family protein